MSVYAGPADWWTDGTDDGRTHIATKGIVQANLVFNLDAGVSSSYPGSGTTWNDLKGNYNGTANTNPNFTSDSGGIITFNGTTDSITINHDAALNPTLNMTLSIWISFTSFATTTFMITKGTTATGGYSLKLDTTGTQLNLVKWGVVDQRVSVSLSTATWYNIVASQGTSAVDYYINGTYINSINNASAYTTNVDNVRIARSNADTYTAAKISNFQFYNRALSAAEIQQNFNALRGRFGI